MFLGSPAESRTSALVNESMVGRYAAEFDACLAEGYGINDDQPGVLHGARGGRTRSIRRWRRGLSNGTAPPSGTAAWSSTRPATWSASSWPSSTASTTHTGKQSVAFHQYVDEDAPEFLSSARRDDEQWPIPREEEQRSRRQEKQAGSSTYWWNATLWFDGRGSGSIIREGDQHGRQNRYPSRCPEILSVFPLTGVLLLPGTRLPLHIFRTPATGTWCMTRWRRRASSA